MKRLSLDHISGKLSISEWVPWRGKHETFSGCFLKAIVTYVLVLQQLTFFSLKRGEKIVGRRRGYLSNPLRLYMCLKSRAEKLVRSIQRHLEAGNVVNTGHAP